MRHRTRHGTSWVSLCVAVVLMLTMAACSSGGDEEHTTGPDGDVLPGTAALAIADLAYEPSVLPVVRGTTEITITNSDTVDHTFTIDTGLGDWWQFVATWGLVICWGLLVSTLILVYRRLKSNSAPPPTNRSRWR